MEWASFFVELIPLMVHAAASLADPSPEELATFDAKTAFFNLKFNDLYHDAGMPDLLVWLRGNKALRIPHEWRPFLPTTLKQGY